MRIYDDNDVILRLYLLSVIEFPVIRVSSNGYDILITLSIGGYTKLLNCPLG